MPKEWQISTMRLVEAMFSSSGRCAPSYMIELKPSLIASWTSSQLPWSRWKITSAFERSARRRVISKERATPQCGMMARPTCRITGLFASSAAQSSASQVSSLCML